MNHFTGSRAMMQEEEKFGTLSKLIDTTSVDDEVRDIDRVLSDIDRTIKVAEWTKSGGLVSICGGKDLDFNGYEPVDMLTLLDGDVLDNCEHDRVNEVMKKLAKAAKELGCTIVLNNGNLWVDIEADGFTEKFRELGKAQRRVALTGGPSRELAGLVKMILVDQSRVKHIDSFDIWNPEEEFKFDNNPNKDWVQKKLRRGAGHNKHSRKGKKK